MRRSRLPRRCTLSEYDGFKRIARIDPSYREVKTRIEDFDQVKIPLAEDIVVLQADRCMDCGVPFCHLHGCPVANRIPDYSDAIAHGAWREALDILHSTNNFPEITGRICPALCEASCTLSVNFSASVCQQIELRIAEHGWEMGWIVPEPPEVESGKRVAIVGSGPAGLATAQQLRRLGHEVVVFEKEDRIGGLLMYGIPNFKLEKGVVDRRIAQLVAEGVVFETKVDVGSDISSRYLLDKFDAVVIATGTQKPRDLPIPGRELEGIHFAVDFLTQQTRMVLGEEVDPKQTIDPKGAHVVVIGGGDTGSDCVGSVLRRGCASVTQIELLPKPPSDRSEDNPWPQWPKILRTSSSHEEGGTRLWSIGTKAFMGESGSVKNLSCVELEWKDGGYGEKSGTEFVLAADLVLLSMGFVPDKDSLLAKSFGLPMDARGNILADRYQAGDKVFIAGDASSGPSLVVRAIAEGRECANEVHKHLMKI